MATSEIKALELASFTFTSAEPYVLAARNNEAIVAVTFLYPVGSKILGITKEGTTISVVDLMTGTAFTDNRFTFTAASNSITFSQTNANKSYVTLMRRA